MGCITKHYLNESTILGVWKIEEDIKTLMSFVDMDRDDRKNTGSLPALPENLSF